MALYHPHPFFSSTFCINIYNIRTKFKKREVVVSLQLNKRPTFFKCKDIKKTQWCLLMLGVMNY